MGVPPLYKVEVSGKKAKYCYDEADLRKVLAEQPEGKNYNIQRFKGRPPLPTSANPGDNCRGREASNKGTPNEKQGADGLPSAPKSCETTSKGKGRR